MIQSCGKEKHRILKEKINNHMYQLTMKVHIHK